MSASLAGGNGCVRSFAPIFSILSISRRQAYSRGSISESFRAASASVMSVPVGDACGRLTSAIFVERWFGALGFLRGGRLGQLGHVLRLARLVAIATDL